MKKKDLYGILKAIEGLSHIKGVKFAYGLAKNKKIIIDDLTLIEESLENLNEEDKKTQDEYNERRMTLITKYSEKDIDGNPLFTDSSKNNYKINKAEQKDFNDCIVELNDDYKEIVIE